MAEAWPDERIAALRGLVEQELNARQISERMGTTRNAILGKCFRLGLRLSLSPEKPVEAVPVPVPPKPREPSPPPPPVAAPAAPIAVEALFVDSKPEAEPEPVEEIPSDGVLMLDLLPHHCRHIAGPVAGLETRYCGRPVVSGSSYCPDHAPAMRGRGTPSERRATEGYRLGGVKKPLSPAQRGFLR